MRQWEGKGTLEKTNGTRYVGEWKADQRHGTGTLWQRQEDGSLRKVYAGQWLNDMQHGRGTLNYRSKDIYVGEWQRGLRAGVGICTCVYAQHLHANLARRRLSSAMAIACSFPTLA